MMQEVFCKITLVIRYVVFLVGWGICSTIATKVWALIHDLQLVWDRGVHLLVFEIDYFLVYYWLNE